MSSRLYLVRHGETEWNRQQRVQGSTDIPLNDTGRAQALASAALLARVEPHAVFASPLLRAFETAEIIARTLGLPVPVPVPKLVERHYGEAEGLNYRQIEKRFPDRSLVPGQEHKKQLSARSMQALQAIARSSDSESTVIVAHAGVIRAILAELHPSGSHGRIANGSIHSLGFDSDLLSLVAFDQLVPPLTAR